MERKLQIIEEATLQELKRDWAEAFGKPPSRYASQEFLRINLAYHRQEKKHGGLNKRTQEHLNQLYLIFKENPDYRPPASKPSLKSGTRLVRQWQGVTHTVTANSDGYEYQGLAYKSLSAIARLITGTRWSGPAFFGLKQQEGV